MFWNHGKLMAQLEHEVAAGTSVTITTLPSEQLYVAIDSYVGTSSDLLQKVYTDYCIKLVAEGWSQTPDNFRWSDPSVVSSFLGGYVTL